MKATVLVRPKDGILDPQGQAVESSLRQLGFAVGEARVGRVVDLEVESNDGWEPPGAYASAGQKRDESGVRASSPRTSCPSSPRPNSNFVSAIRIPR